MTRQISDCNVGDKRSVQKAYETFWRRVANLYRQAEDLPGSGLSSSRVKDPSGGFFFVTVSTISPLVFKAVKSRQRKQKLTFDIYLETQQAVRKTVDEDFKNPDYEIFKSNVRILYVESRGRAEIRREKEGGVPARRYRGMHFDSSTDAYHPVFHVQVDQKCIPDERLDRKCEEIPDFRLDEPRVPVPPLSLPGIVAMIAQDHLMDSELNLEKRLAAMQELRSASAALPFLCDEIRPGCLPRLDSVPSIGWYRH